MIDIENYIKKLMIEYSSPEKTLNTDKASFHAYEEFYSKRLIPYVNKKINLLEIGVAQGVSLKMWKNILPEAIIYGSDSNYGYLKYSMSDFVDTMFLPQGDQTDPNVFKNIPNMDVIIDDASHIAVNTMKTFEILKNKITTGGMYVIEDVWENQLQQYHHDFLKNFEIVDLRKHKKREDDILLVFYK